MQADQNAPTEAQPSTHACKQLSTHVPTQIRHPWRATARTVIAAAVGALALIPVIATTAGLDTIPWVAAAVAVAGGVTRVLAIPAVDGWLRQFQPWLATTPPQPTKSA